MVGEDLDEVMRIEEGSFSSPWSRGMFLGELKDNPFSNFLTARLIDPNRMGGTCLPLPVRQAGAGRSEDKPWVSPHGPPHIIVGYCCFWVVFGEVHIMNLAVHPDWRRKGIATRFVEETISISRKQAVQKIHLEVRRSNEPARRLYEKFGFEVIAIRPNYYTQPREDALLMAMDLV